MRPDSRRRKVRVSSRAASWKAWPSRTARRSIARLHIVGGGSQSALLNQFAANATGREVIAGPVEATAAGNVLIQAIALGQLESLDALRKIVSDSFPLRAFKPLDMKNWEDAYDRFTQLKIAT